MLASDEVKSQGVDAGFILVFTFKPVFFLLSEYATYDLVFLKDRKYGN